MKRISRASFFLTVFVVSLIWCLVTLLILVLHEQSFRDEYILSNIGLKDNFDSAEYLQKRNVVLNSTFKAAAEKNKNQKDNDKLKVANQNGDIRRNILDGKSNKQAFESNKQLNKSISRIKHQIKQRIQKLKLEDHDKSKTKRPEKMIQEGQSELERLKHLDEIAPVDGPGEFGNPVKINMSQLTSDQKRQYDKLYKLNSYNQYASDMVSLHRRLKDIRNPECKAKIYPKGLPNTSVIICFHNEAWSVLLRSVHSIIDRSPSYLIKEIILVDDFSDLDHLKKPLEDYISQKSLTMVKLVRTKKREGLVRARLLGYSISTGDTLTFLDSHIECFPGWLEPLLHRIHIDPTIAVAPLIPMISDNTMGTQQRVAVLASVGGFDMDKVSFNWASIPKKFEPKTVADSVKTPTIAGGLYTISRDFFTKVGTYDAGMDIWGGENLEISFRIWMCGGSLEIHPCSSVGHIYRKVTPYKWGKSYFDIIRHNSVRVAEVWMDDYKDIYYERLGYNLGDYGDVTERKELRKKLNCHSFDWYIKNVFPNVKIPERSIYSGEIRNVDVSAICIDSMGGQGMRMVDVLGQPCHNQGGNQHFRMLKDGTIGRDHECLDFNEIKQKLYFIRCSKSKSQKWEYTEDQQLILKHLNLCLELGIDRNVLALRNCKNAPQQKWTWSKKHKQF